jgi:hypothetical protein
MLIRIFSIVSAANNAKEVGRQVGKFIQTSNINPQLVHCIGHSLGAHACGKYIILEIIILDRMIILILLENLGFVGKTIKIRRISGLDPAGINFLFFSSKD